MESNENHYQFNDLVDMYCRSKQPRNSALQQEETGRSRLYGHAARVNLADYIGSEIAKLIRQVGAQNERANPLVVDKVRLSSHLGVSVHWTIRR